MLKTYYLMLGHSVYMPSLPCGFAQNQMFALFKNSALYTNVCGSYMLFLSLH